MRQSCLILSSALFLGCAFSLSLCLPVAAQPALAGEPRGCGGDSPPAVLSEGLALKRMLACNRDLVAARRAIAGARADQTVAGQPLNPTFTAGVSNINPRLGIGSGPLSEKTVDSSVRLEQVFERGGKLGFRQRQAESTLAATEQDLAEITRQTCQAVLQAMVDIAAADGKVTLQSEVASLYGESLAASERRAERGDLAPIDAQRQAIEATRARADLRTAQADARRARLALANLLAWEAQASALVISPSILDINVASPNLVDPTTRADVKAARARVAAALAGRDLAKAQSKADVTFGVQFDRWPTSPSNPSGTGNSIGFTVSIPLMVRHTFDGELARASSDSEAARENLQRLTANSQSEWARLNDDVSNAASGRASGRDRLHKGCVGPA
jgi:outer membrane protein, heavy metal efflux system